MDPVIEFCEAVRARSRDHERAMRACEGIPSQQVAILRQELDSMLRVIFLLSLEQDARAACLNQFGAGDRWRRTTERGRQAIVIDAEMLELARHLHGWTASVYKFGCDFIHLSRLADYRRVDPLHLVTPEERRDILTYLRSYHGFPNGNGVTFDQIVMLLPAVLEKITGNLRHYVERLEAGGSLWSDTM